MSNKITILFLIDRNSIEQKEKAKLMIQSFINKSNVINHKETKEELFIETETHQIKIISLSQSPRGYKANFMFDLSGHKEAKEAAHNNSTYNWNIAQEVVNNQVYNNGWDIMQK
ncbi:hypothetical protein ACI3ER_12105 [Bacillus sp. Wb]